MATVDLQQSNNAERGNNQYQGQEMAIQCHSYGGLNTTANPLNLPYEDSPLMRNVITDVSGAISKRKGTRIVYRDVNTYDNVTLMPVVTSLSYNLLCAKTGTSLRVFELRNQQASLVITKNNVWSSIASQVRASWTLTSEPSPRLLIMTGVNKPVQVQFIERQISSPGGTSHVFTNAEQIRSASTASCILWVNRQRYTGSVSYSYNAGTQELTVTTGTSLALGDVIDITFVCWQWWAEAQHWYGDRIFGSETRFNAVPTDQVVKVPSRLTSDIDYEDTVSGDWSIYAWKLNARLGTYQYTRVATAKPQVWDEYWFSDGKRYVYDVNATTNPTPYFVTFGATTGSTPITVYFSRDRQLKFRNGLGQTGSNVDVFVDGTLRTQFTTFSGSTFLQYGLRDVSKSLCTSTSQVGKYVTFTAEARMGLSPTSYTEFINKEPTHIGSAALPARFHPVVMDGSYVPIYGLGQFADYLNGFYPSVVDTYQDRVVISGFEHRPMLVLFSNVSDSVTSGTRYNFFQITDDELCLRDSAPFDIELNKQGSDDRVVALIEWQRSLFVLTRRATYRVSGSVERVLKFDNKFITYLSSTGCVNANSVVRTETSINYLSDTGLYDLAPRVEDGEYIVDEKSLKIRGKFGITRDPSYEELAWVAYDPQEKYIYVGYPAEGNTWTSVYLYVYSITRNSWTEFDTQGFFRAFDATAFTDRVLGLQFIMACTTEQNETTGAIYGRPENLILLKLSDSKYLDFIQTATRTTTSEQYWTLQTPTVSYTTTTIWEQTTDYSYEALREPRAFNPLPMQDVEDVVCTIDPPSAPPYTSVFNSGWFKKPGHFFYLNEIIPAGSVVSYRWKPDNALENSQGYTHMVVLVNNIPNLDWILGGTDTVNGRYFTLPSSVPSNANLEWGMVYPAVYFSPVFFSNDMKTYKRLRHLYLFFDNKNYFGVYTPADVNTTQSPPQDPEEIVNLVKQRVNASVSVMYNSNAAGTTNTDVYGFSELFYDESVFDFDPAAEQSHEYSVFKEPIIGVGFSYQVAVWSVDESVFKLAGYQIDLKQKGKQFTGRF